MKKVIRIISISIAFSLSIAAFAGCSADKKALTNMTPDKTTPEYKVWAGTNRPLNATEHVQTQWDKWNIGKDLSLDWFIGLPSHTYLKDWSEYSLLKEVVEITGVSPKVNVPAGDPTERLNIMITMDEWPDLITVGYGDPIINKLIENGSVYSMEELSALYAPEFVKSELPQSLVDDTKSDIDQKLYGIPGGYLLDFLCKSKDGVGAYTYSVRKEFYNALGKPSIATLDDFYNALKAFKTKYPTLNGKPSIPLCLGTNGVEGITTLRYSFGIQDYFTRDDGTLTSYAYNPKFKELMLFLNKLNREGLIDPDALVKPKSVIDQDLATRTFMCPSYFWYLDAANASLATEKPSDRYISIDPLNNTGTTTVSFPGLTRLGGQLTLIPKKAKNPEAAFKFLRYMISEDGNMQMMYGHESEHYTYVEKEGVSWIQRTAFVQEQWTTNYAGFNEQTGMFAFVYAFLKPKPEIGKEHPDRMAYDRPIANKYCYDNTLFTFNMAPDPSTDEGIALQKMGDIQAKELYRIISAETEDAAITQYQSFLTRISEVNNLAKVESYLTSQYNKNVAKFKGPKY